MKKKLYNPFKMIGSWIGASLYGAYGIWFTLSNYGMNTTNPGIIQSNLSIPGMVLFNSLWGLILNPVLGFLIGWGINSLWRKFK